MEDGQKPQSLLVNCLLTKEEKFKFVALWNLGINHTASENFKSRQAQISGMVLKFTLAFSQTKLG